MKNLRSFVILVLLALGAVYGTFALRQPPATVERSGELLFPGLLEKLNEAGGIEIRSGGESFELSVKDGTWAVPGAGGYPADAEKVRRLLIGAASLVRVEPKTSNPELYAKLDLDDPESAESLARGLRLAGAGGSELAAVIVGKSRPARGDPDSSEYYVRLPGEDQVWLVQGRLPAGASEADWIDKSVLDIDAERVRQVTVRHADGEVVTVTRESPGDTDFVLEGLPEGAELEDRWRVNDLGRGLASLELEDVEPAEGAAESEPAYKVTLETFDGLVVELDAGKSGDATVGALSARYEAPAGPAGKEGADADEAEEGESGGGAKNDAEETSATDPESLKAEAEALNARWRGWRYTLPAFKAGYFQRRQVDFVKADVAESLDRALSEPADDAPAESAPADAPSPAPDADPPAAESETGG